MLWGIIGVQKEAVLAARRALVTVEEVVDVLEPRAGAIVIPSWAVSHVAAVPGGAHPSYAQGYSTTRQRLLPRVGPHLVGPRPLHRLAGRQRARHRRGHDVSAPALLGKIRVRR